jgi:ABC-type thiamine transport system substrate-binding protein
LSALLRKFENRTERCQNEDHLDFIIQRKLVFNESEILKNLLNKEKMKRAITMKRNMSAPGLDKLTYSILKYEKDDAAELMEHIMNMMLRLKWCS